MPGLRRLSSAGETLPRHSREKMTRPPVDDAYSDTDSESDVASHLSAQAGVKRLEATAALWSKWSLIFAYGGLYMMAYATSLEGQVTTNLTVFATSSFKAHALISTVSVIQGVVLSIVKPPMAKVADVWGRFEAFTFSVFLFTLGYIQQAAANNVKTYAAAQIFYSAGATGLQILQQIFIADTSDLLNRAIVSTIPDIPYLLNVWIGPPIANSILKNLSWRWGYGIWAIILPVAYLPLALALSLNQRKASKMGILPPSPFVGKDWLYTLKSLWFEMDIFGLLLLLVGVALLLIPLTLGASAPGDWSNGSIIAMLVCGLVCLCVFPLWERNPRLAPRAFFPPHLFRSTTVIAGVLIAFFYFMVYYLSVQPYFYSYLLVVQGKSVSAAGHITQTFTFTATVTSICTSIVIKYTKHYKYFVTVGASIYLLGVIMMLRYRTEGVSDFYLIGCQVLVGIGGGMLHVPAQLGVQASVGHGEVGAVTAAFLTILEIGGAVGSAISGAIWSSNVPVKLAQYLPEETRDQAKEIFGSVKVASTEYAMGTPTRIAINRAYQETMTKILTVAVLVCIPLIPLSLMMKNYKLDEMDQHVRGTVIGNTSEASDPSEREPFAASSSGHRRYDSEDDIDYDYDRTIRSVASNNGLRTWKSNASLHLDDD
ncbi:MFS general substrate transporter [Aureobasidium pullulans]|uniref:MFS general substrate transporter n=1 Tax=Aureobasidium pullulans TaxID=5580 RepID=A0A4S8ZU68_AURPU|nr:MFS general substrate transporter [Aureobasidium pullulans]TIA31632.1 MFS general substrate transporter [Aureobasidium pullulans]